MNGCFFENEMKDGKCRVQKVIASAILLISNVTPKYGYAKYEPIGEAPF